MRISVGIRIGWNTISLLVTHVDEDHMVLLLAIHPGFLIRTFLEWTCWVCSANLSTLISYPDFSQVDILGLQYKCVNFWHLVGHVDEEHVVLLLAERRDLLPLLGRGVHARGVVRACVEHEDRAVLCRLSVMIRIYIG